MPKFLTAALLLCACFSFSQNISISGKAIDDKTKLPLESATVYLTRASDSTVVDYTITDKSGVFLLKTRKSEKPHMLKVSFIGYADYAREEKSLSANIDIGVVNMKETGNNLKEIVLQSEAPPIRVKNDTLEFNASSFKLRPDANVEALLKQLPGVEIDDQGKITVNGKEVNQILVNGKPFFDKDGKIALQNLPSDIVNKVQVTDSKTKAEEISGKTASSDNASINLTIDQDKNKGLFGKFTGGYGSNDRFQSSMLLNYFKDQRKVSVLASANNINSTGFSMNEIFDNMGGGRNYSVWSNDDGSFGINGMQFGGGRGITRSTIVGANYADQFFKKLDTNASYFYTGASTENHNVTHALNLLPEGNFTTDSDSRTKDIRWAHNFNALLEYKIDSTATLTFNPKYIRSFTSSKARTVQSSHDASGNLLNESQANTQSDANKNEFQDSFYFYKSFKRKGRSVGAGFDNENSSQDSFDLNRSQTTFYNDTDGDGIPDTPKQDNRDQIKRMRTVRDHYSGNIEYNEPIADSLSVSVQLQFEHERNTDYKRTFDFQGGGYTAFNDSLSSVMRGQIMRFSPGAGLVFQRKKFNFNVYGYTRISEFDADGFYLGQATSRNRNYLLPSANAYISYKFSKSRSLWVYYNADVDFPDAYQVLPIANYSNPLVTFVGNPSLDPSLHQNVYLNFRDYDYTTKSGYTIYAGGNYFNRSIAGSTTYDESRKRTVTYRNVFGTYNSWFGGNWSKSLKKEANTYKLSLGLNMGLNRDKGFIDSEQFSARSLRMTPKVNFNYDYGELLSINPSYSYTFNESFYDNYTVNRATNFVHDVKLQATAYWPKHVVFGNDVSYRYNSNIASGFRKDFYLWNVSLGYNFFHDQLLAKAMVYDLLDQNQGTSRTVSATSIREEENIVLKRYLMFSLTYKLQKFGGKKKEESHFWWQDD